MATYRISFQLYSARDSGPIDGQLEALAAIGYDAVEPYGGNFLADPKGLRAKADALGLTIPTAHMPLAELDKDFGHALDMARTLGLETVVIPHIAPPDRPETVDGWKAFAGRLAVHAARLKDAGLKLAWHNHDFEFRPLPDKSRPIDHLLAADGVLSEADLGWIVRAGCDVAAEVERFGKSIAALHIKDTAKEGVTEDDGWTDVGAGIIDWVALWPAIGKTGADLLVMEHDKPSDWRSFAANSYKYVSGLIGRN